MNIWILLPIIFLALESHAQVRSVWLANVPGHERKWEHPGNWSMNAVPDEFTDVVIPLDISVRRNYPVLSEERAEVNSLIIWPGATLIIRSGILVASDEMKNQFSRGQVIGRGLVMNGIEQEPHYLAKRN